MTDDTVVAESSFFPEASIVREFFHYWLTGKKIYLMRAIGDKREVYRMEFVKDEIFDEKETSL